MRKFIFTFAILLFLIGVRAEALNFNEAFSQTDKTPMVVLIYAQWAPGYQGYIQQFRTVQPKLKNVYNFVELDIASSDTIFFNSRYQIYPNLPYIIMFRNSGKISRYIPRDCAANAACIEQKLKSFMQ